MNTPSAKKA